MPNQQCQSTEGKQSYIHKIPKDLSILSCHSICTAIITSVFPDPQCFINVLLYTGTIVVVTVRSELRKVLFLEPSMTFLFVNQISRELLNRFASNSHGRRVWSLAGMSLNTKVKGQGHQGQKCAVRSHHTPPPPPGSDRSILLHDTL